MFQDSFRHFDVPVTQNNVKLASVVHNNRMNQTEQEKPCARQYKATGVREGKQAKQKVLSLFFFFYKSYNVFTPLPNTASMPALAVKTPFQLHRAEMTAPASPL